MLWKSTVVIGKSSINVFHSYVSLLEGSAYNDSINHNAVIMYDKYGKMCSSSILGVSLNGAFLKSGSIPPGIIQFRRIFLKINHPSIIHHPGATPIPKFSNRASKQSCCRVASEPQRTSCHKASFWAQVRCVFSLSEWVMGYRFLNIVMAWWWCFIIWLIIWPKWWLNNS